MYNNKKRIKEHEATIKSLEETIRDYKYEIQGLEREAKYREKEFALREKELKTEADEENLSIEKKFAKETAVNEQLRERLRESPYQQLTDILKALVVKLPTLEIKELSVSAKDKK